MKILTMRCVNCGSALEIPPEMSHFSCAYCGTHQVVERFGGTVVLKAVIDAVAKVQDGTDRTAAELALARLKVELEDLDKKLARPFGSLPEVQTQAALAKHPMTAGQVVAAGVFVLVGLFLLFLLFALFRSGEIDNMGSFVAFLLVNVAALVVSGYIAFGRQLSELNNAEERQRQALVAERERVLQEIEENYAKIGRTGERAG